MKRYLLVLLVLPVVVLAGCDTNHSGEMDKLNEIIERVKEKQDAKLIDYEPFDSITINRQVNGSATWFEIYPPVVELYRMKVDRVVDTWQKDDTLGFYNEGDPSGVFIINHTDRELKFDVSVERKTKGYCKLTNTEGYVKPPAYVEDWIVIGEQALVLQPKEVRLVPVALIMPSDVDVFAPYWEFQVKVHLEREVMVQDAQAQRWLVHMDGYPVLMWDGIE